MIRPAKRLGNRVVPLSRPRSQAYSIPAPVGGWNARDSIAAMDEKDAIQLDNWFPEASYLRMRNGFTSYVTGLGAQIETLATWAGGSSQKMFGAAGTKIYDVTSAGAVGAAVQTGLTSARWQYANFGISSGSYLYMVNGEDAPRYYNGTSWTTPTITGSGLTASNLVNIGVFKRALFFCETAKLGFWYFPVETISGSISYFDLGPVCPLGGYLMAVGSWTRDSGNGPSDLAVFLTSRGEAAIYSGTDPSDSTAWSHIGTFRIGAPIGRRCMVNVGADLVLVTEDGFAPLSNLLSTQRLSQRAALSDKIANAVTDATASYRTHFGWQPIFYPRGHMVLFNIPVVENGTTYQYVSNSTTGAWCRFTGMDANCWGVLDEDLYFGGDGTVWKADNGLADNDGEITLDAKTAFSYFRTRQLKKFNEARPIFETDGDLTAALEVQVDFADSLPSATPTFTAATGATWDTATWDVDAWSDTARILKSWQSVGAVGYAAAVRMRATMKSANLKWHATDFLWEPGGLL